MLPGPISVKIAFKEKNDRRTNLAQPSCRTHQNLQDFIEIKARAIDGLKHFGRRGLLLQGLLKFASESIIFSFRVACGSAMLFGALWFLTPFSRNKALSACFQ